MSDDTAVLEWDEPDAAPPRRRRRWPWLVAFVIVLVLIVAAFFAGEWIARDLVTKAVKQQLTSRLALPADQEIDVTIGDPSLLFALAAGTVGEVSVSSDDVTIGSVSGDVSVTLRDLSIRAPFTLGSGTATVQLDAAQLSALLAGSASIPVESVGLQAPDVTASTSLSVLGLTVPVALVLTPTADAGDLLLTPVSLQVAGAEMTADGVRAQFGSLADPLLAGYRVCVAQYLPAGVPLTGIQVLGDELVADFDIRGDVLTDQAARENGTCD